ncbi:MAG: hypothetical protein R3199_07060 [Gemmatimonadota bacterium]|nr:hypothetical protein [Gemmatimonadota bacterium]
MPNFSLEDLKKEYETDRMRTLINRMLREHPDWAECSIVSYVVNDTGETRVMVCPTQDEVRQIFLSPHCREARTLRVADEPETEEAEADAA